MKRKHSSAQRALNSIWVLLTILLLIIAFYFQWQHYRIKQQEQLKVIANQLEVKLDHLIDTILHAGYSMPLYGRELKECQHDLLPILRRLNFNNSGISGAVIIDKNNKIICSTTGLEHPLPTPTSHYPALYGPITLEMRKPSLLLEQQLGEYYLGIYILESYFEDLIKSASSKDKLVAIYDDQQQKTLFKVGNHSLLLNQSNLNSLNTTSTPLLNVHNLRVVIAASPLQINSDFILQELPLTLVISLISFLLYYKFRAMLNNRYSLHYALANALKQNHFQPMYQPIRNDAENRYCGAEVLLRWQTDLNEIIMPDTFIEDAEKSGIIVPITLQLIEKTFHQSHDFLKRHPDFHLAFNLSASHFSDIDFFTKFFELCTDFKIPATQIMLELTERELLDQDNSQLVIIMKDLRAKGYSLAIDDFGTGHASIKYLQHFPFNYLKIDKIFVQAIGTGAITETLNQAIIHLAKCLDLKIIAEGVETTGQIDFLRKKQVIFMQGWYFEKALSYEHLLRVVEGGSG